MLYVFRELADRIVSWGFTESGAFRGLIACVCVYTPEHDKIIDQVIRARLTFVLLLIERHTCYGNALLFTRSIKEYICRDVFKRAEWEAQGYEKSAPAGAYVHLVHRLSASKCAECTDVRPCGCVQVHRFWKGALVGALVKSQVRAQCTARTLRASASVILPDRSRGRI